MRKDKIRSTTTFEFEIKRFTPATLPMRRLVSYLGKLAELFGNDEFVHFSWLVKGSAIPKINVDQPAAPNVMARLASAKHPGGPAELLRAKEELNDMLRNDHTSAILKDPKGAQILVFPGRNTPPITAALVHENCELRGIVRRVGGKDSTVPVWIEYEPGNYYYCTTTRSLSAEMAHCYDQEVSVRGPAKWRRDEDGQWTLQEFRIEGFDPIGERLGLIEALEAMRSIEGSGWNALDDPLGELKRIRGGS